MGFGGGLLLATVQAALADHHGERRAVALAEANVAASVAYVVLIGVLSLTAALHAGVAGRVARLARDPACSRGGQPPLAIDAPPPRPDGAGRLPGVFWAAAAVLFCIMAAEWCITAWGATFVQDVTGVSADTAVALMVAYFVGVVAGRALGSRLARRYDPARLLARGARGHRHRFVVLWPRPRRRRPWSGCRCSGSGSATCSRWGCP